MAVSKIKAVIEFRQAVIKDAELLIKIYNASFYSDYIRYC